ncbi:MAG: hypothetical protein C0515_00780 [Novosphingobium sp.]|nr:hypothetical protein [Novosphingobium sp.]MBX9643783.1 hypothetical protein [Novosphingobium sp.]
MADKKKSDSKEGHHKQEPTGFPSASAIDNAVTKAISVAYGFSVTPSTPEIDALSHTAAAQLDELLTDLAAQIEPTHTQKAGNVPPDTPFHAQQEKDYSDADSGLQSAIANATLAWTQAEIAWNQATAAYDFQIKSAEWTMNAAVTAAKSVYQPTLINMDSAPSGGIARYMTFQLAVAEAIEAFLAAVAAAASALASAEGALRSANIELTTAIYAAQSAAQTARVTADQTFWQSCQAING